MKRTLILTLALSTCLSTAAFAAKKAPDVYPATEDTPSEEVIQSAPGYQAGVLPPVQTAQPAQPIQLQATSTKPTQDTMTTGRYDAVPGPQTEPLLRRLHLVETLITKYGRAYDYRTLTVTQLETILGELDAQANQTSELKRRMNARTEMKKELAVESADEPAGVKPPAPPAQIDDIPAPSAESTNSIGNEAPESADSILPTP